MVGREEDGEAEGEAVGAVGDTDGEAEGDTDGEADGDADGEADGEAEGDADGEADGEAEGDAVGAVGDTDGEAEGEEEGDKEGDADGEADGEAEGEEEGDKEGDAEGEADGEAEGDADGEEEGERVSTSATIDVLLTTNTVLSVYVILTVTLPDSMPSLTSLKVANTSSSVVLGSTVMLTWTSSSPVLLRLLDPEARCVTLTSWKSLVSAPHPKVSARILLKCSMSSSLRLSINCTAKSS